MCGDAYVTSDARKLAGLDVSPAAVYTGSRSQKHVSWRPAGLVGLTSAPVSSTDDRVARAVVRFVRPCRATDPISLHIVTPSYGSCAD